MYQSKREVEKTVLPPPSRHPGTATCQEGALYTQNEMILALTFRPLNCTNSSVGQLPLKPKP